MCSGVPLLDFDRIAFLKRHRSSYNHMVDQYFGAKQKPGGGVFVLESPFSETPGATDLLGASTVGDGRLAGKPLGGGAFLSLDVDYDARALAFAWTEAKRTLRQGPVRFVTHWDKDSTFHIFSIKADGTALTQLTEGVWNDFDPCFLPNGRLAFVSERRGGEVRCSQRPDPTFTLHSMRSDGSDLIRLSWHDTNEWHPSVGNNGMILYSRWDYVDRSPNIAHHLWTCFPDGRDPRSYHGNYPEYMTDRPFAEMHMRAVPGSRRVACVAVPHHGQAFGSLILVDPSVPDDNRMSQVKRVTPDIPFPESEVNTRGYKLRTSNVSAPWCAGSGEAISSPWPLSEDFYLCAYDRHARNYGVYLIDSFGNHELLYRDRTIPCVDPIPLVPRPRPPAIPVATEQAADSDWESGAAKGTIGILNVYESDFEWPEGTRIAALRIIQLFPRLTYKQTVPNIGAARQSMARGVLGTVPVEADGSAFFEAPAGKILYFQALDGKGRAVQSMRSATYLHPGERLTCVGCHENKWQTPGVDAVRMAFGRPPSSIRPEADGAYPVSFPRLVQPVLDAKCVDCHTKDRKAPDLSANATIRQWPDHIETGRAKGKAVKGTDWGWSEAMMSLIPFTTYHGGRTNAIHLPYGKGGGPRSVAGRVGALGSALYPMLRDGHHNVELTDTEMHRFVLWMDTNCMFYGAYRETEKQLAGELVTPLLE